MIISRCCSGGVKPPNLVLFFIIECNICIGRKTAWFGRRWIHWRTRLLLSGYAVSVIPIITVQISDTFFYVTNAHIKAQEVYKFKIAAALISSSIRYSEWSREVSFTHVYPVHPVIQQLVPTNATHTKITWIYSSMASYPISRYDILIRRTRQDGQKVSYYPFSRIHVTDPNATVITLIMSTAFIQSSYSKHI